MIEMSLMGNDDRAAEERLLDDERMMTRCTQVALNEPLVTSIASRPLNNENSGCTYLLSSVSDAL